MDDHQKIYDSVPRTEDVFNLNRKDLELYDKLGTGRHGDGSGGARDGRVSARVVASCSVVDRSVCSKGFHFLRKDISALLLSETITTTQEFQPTNEICDLFFFGKYLTRVIMK